MNNSDETLTVNSSNTLYFSSGNSNVVFSKGGNVDLGCVNPSVKL